MTLTPRSIAFAPGGERLAVTARRADGTEAVLVVELATGAIDTLAAGESQPTWGPGGALVTTVGAPDAMANVVLRAPGCRPADVGMVPAPVVALAVLLGGDVIAFAATPPGRRPNSHALSHATRRVVNKSDHDGYVGDGRPALHLLDVRSGTVRVVDIARGAAVEALCASPDGARLAVRARRDNLFEELSVLDARDGTVAPVAVGERSVLGALSWVDEHRLLAAVDAEGGWHPSTLAVLAAAGCSVLAPDAGLDVHGADRHVVWGAQRGRAVVAALDLDTGVLAQRFSLPVGAYALTHDAASGRTAAIAGPAAGPLELLWAEPGGATEALELSGARAARRAMSIPEPEVLAVGEVECFLARPAGRVERLVVDLHGGPFGSWGGGYDPLHAALLAAGFAVVTPNVHGSTSYGRAHAAAIVGAWGELDLADVLAAADAAAAHLGCDPARAGVAGYSYGGYLAGMLVATTARFAAAVCGAPVWDLRSSFGTGDEAEAALALNSLGLTGHELLARADRHSPARRLGRPSTPTLLLAGEADWSCPLSQSEQALFDLSWLGCEVELVRYPGQNHASLWDGDAAVVADRVRRTVAWLADRV